MDKRKVKKIRNQPSWRGLKKKNLGNQYQHRKKDGKVEKEFLMKK